MYQSGVNETMEDVTGLSHQPKSLQTQQGGQILKLDDWIELKIGNTVVISGVINNHPNFVNGQRFVTDSLQCFKTTANGRVFAMTTCSCYELGQRLSEYDVHARHSFEEALGILLKMS